MVALEVGGVTLQAWVWVNGEPVQRRVLVSGDLIEVGSGGPVLRYRLYAPGSRPFKSFREVFNDCLDSARYGGRSTRGPGIHGPGGRG